LQGPHRCPYSSDEWCDSNTHESYDSVLVGTGKRKGLESWTGQSWSDCTVSPVSPSHRVSLVVKWYCVLGGIHLMSLVWHMKRQSDPS